MLGNALHFSIGARAHRPEANGRAPGSLASFAIEALWVVVVGALFFGWLSRDGAPQFEPSHAYG